MWRYQSYDEGRTDSGKTSSGWNPAFNLYLYIFIHRCINFFAILVSQARCYYNLYLLSFIVTMYLTKFLYEQYSNSRVLIHRGVRGGGSGEPPFFQINYIHSMAWHACLACK